MDKPTEINKRILFVITGLHLGGAEMQLLMLSRSLMQRGFAITVVVMRPGGVLQESFEDQGIEVLNLNIVGFSSIIKSVTALKKIIIERSPFVVHSHMIHANIFARLVRLFCKMRKLICTAHNISEGRRAIMSLYRFTDALSDVDTNVSLEAVEAYVNQGYFSAKKSFYIPNGIDTTLFSYHASIRDVTREQLELVDQTFVFLAVGRLHPQKDYPNLLEAFSKFVKAGHVNSQLLIVGEGELRSDIEDRIAHLGLENQVTLLGRRTDVNALMNAADCFVLSSAFEGFGLVVAEALACTLPVIATDCGGVREVLGGNGILVEKKNSDILALRMSDYYSQYPGRSEDGRQHVLQNYAMDGVTDKWIEIYRK